MSTEIPETVNAADVTSWSDEVDVVVIGFGIAGGCAAVSAAAAGARVLVLERAAAAGGTSAMAGGHFYLGGGTAVQQATGHTDSRRGDVQVPRRGVARPGARQDPRLLRGQRRTLQLVGGLGFSVRAQLLPGTRSSSRRAPRACRTRATRRCGRSASRQSPRRAGTRCRSPVNSVALPWSSTCWSSAPTNSALQVRYETGVTNLIVDDRSVVGVSWKHFTETGAIKANAVVIAAGGFAMNPEMVAEHTPALGQKRRTKHHGLVEPYILGSPNDDGLGIRMGVSAGGVAKNLDQMFITAAAYPPEILLTGIIVNNQGQRFVAEDSYHSRTSAFVLEQPDQAAFLIVDEAHTEMPALPLIRFIDGWETVEEMEQALGIPEGKLVATSATGTTKMRHAARIPTSTSSRNTLRHKILGRGRRSISRWAARCTPGSPWADWRCPSTARCCGMTARRFLGCTPPARAHRTSPRTVRAMPAVPSWARARSSAGAQRAENPFRASRRRSPYAACRGTCVSSRGTRPAPVARRPGRAATRRRPATADAARGAARRWGGG